MARTFQEGISGMYSVSRAGLKELNMLARLYDQTSAWHDFFTQMLQLMQFKLIRLMVIDKKRHKICINSWLTLIQKRTSRTVVSKRRLLITNIMNS